MENRFEDKLEFVRSTLSEEILLDSLAEEAAELAQAALKVSRIYRQQNYTPTLSVEAKQNLIEELTDVYLVANALLLTASGSVYDAKLDRWAKRLKENPPRKD